MVVGFDQFVNDSGNPGGFPWALLKRSLIARLAAARQLYAEFPGIGIGGMGLKIFERQLFTRLRQWKCLLRRGRFDDCSYLIDVPESPAANPSRSTPMPALESLSIAGAYRLRPRPARDARGWFIRYLDTEALSEAVPGLGFVHFNHSRTEHQGSVRGLHLQVGAAAEVKLVKCVRGAVLDVLVDCRRGSPTFLQYALVELVEGPGDAVLIPKGVAHGFQTLHDHTELIYHHSHPYRPDAERGLRYDDPRIGIDWPMPVAEVSGKDRAWPLVEDSFDGYEVDP